MIEIKCVNQNKYKVGNGVLLGYIELKDESYNNESWYFRSIGDKGVNEQQLKNILKHLKKLNKEIK